MFKNNGLKNSLYGPKVYDAINSMDALRKLPGGLHRDVYRAVALARRYCEEVVKPHVKSVDLKVTEDHNYIPYDFIRETCKWGLYSMWIPKMFGGKGMHFLSLSVH
jgi:alkylation response protein AidB-like acyl-CoA dehydrogenase